MRTAEILEKMIAGARGHLHDISHFISVWGYARTIGELEGLDPGMYWLCGNNSATERNPARGFINKLYPTFFKTL